MAVSPSNLKILTKAVQKKHCVAVKFYGSSQITTVEPHAIYLDHNSGIAIDCFQKSDAVGELLSYGAWDTVAWRNIETVFWLNASFSPRFKQGFVPEDEKYSRGLIAIVGGERNPNVNDVILKDIESSIDQLLAGAPAPPSKK